MTKILIVLFAFITLGFGQEPDTLTLIHISDTHICNLADYHPALAESRRKFGNGFILLQKFLDSIPAKINARAVVITGDIVDFYEGETPDSQVRPGQIQYFKLIYDKSPVTMLIALGNHDLYSYWSGLTGKSSPPQFNSQEARAEWIRNISCFSRGTYYSLVYVMGGVTYRLIFLDDSYRLQEGSVDNFWGRRQLEWLDYTLQQAQDEKVLLFYHIPLPVNDTNADSIHFLAPPPGWPTPETFESGIMKILNNHSNIKAAFVGHNHRNIVEEMPLPAGHSIWQIETASFGMDPENWRKVQLTSTGILVSYPAGEGNEVRISFKQ